MKDSNIATFPMNIASWGEGGGGGGYCSISHGPVLSVSSHIVEPLYKGLQWGTKSWPLYSGALISGVDLGYSYTVWGRGDPLPPNQDTLRCLLIASTEFSLGGGGGGAGINFSYFHEPEGGF